MLHTISLLDNIKLKRDRYESLKKKKRKQYTKMISPIYS